MDIKQEQDIFSILVEVDRIIDQNQEIVSFYDRIITKEEFDKEVKSLTGYGHKDLPSFELASVLLRSRITSIMEYESNSFLTAYTLKQSLKKELINRYKKQGFINENLSKVLDNFLIIAEQSFDAETYPSILKPQLEMLKHNEKTLLQQEMQHQLQHINKLFEKYGNFFADINLELKELEDRSVEDIKQNLKLLKDRIDLLKYRKILEEFYNNLSFEDKNKVSIFNFHKHISGFISLGLPEKTAYNRVLELVKFASDKDDYNLLIAQTIPQIDQINDIIPKKYHQLDYNVKLYIAEDNFKDKFYLLFEKGYDCSEIVEIIVSVAKNTIDFNNKIENIPNKRETYNRGRDAKHELKDYNNTPVDHDLQHKMVIDEPNYSHHAASTSSHIDVNSFNNQTAPIYGGISYSKMYNFGSTCWFNSSIKFIYVYYGIDKINQILKQNRTSNNYDDNPLLKNTYGNFLNETANLFNALANNKPISLEIHQFFQTFCQYAYMLEQQNINNYDVSVIFNCVRNAIDINNDSVNINIDQIQQQDAEMFIESFINFLGFNADNGEFIKKSFRKMIFNKKDLAKIGVNISKNLLEIKVEQSAIVKGIYRPLETANINFENYNFGQEDFRDYLARGIGTSNLHKNQIIEIINYSLDSDGNIKIPATCGIEDKFFADIKKLSKFMLDLNYAIKTYYGLVKDTDKNQVELAKIYPVIRLEVTDINTNKNYTVEAKAHTMVCHAGEGGDFAGGHYTTITIDNNDNIIIHGDSSIITIDEAYSMLEQNTDKTNDFVQKSNLEKLLEYGKLFGSYPKNIGFKVVSITENNAASRK